MLDGTWRERLRAAIEESGKSARAVSLASGAGPGYVHSILKEGKDPGIESLFAVCDAIPPSPLRILLGVEALPEDTEILKALHENPHARAAILALLGASGARRVG